MINKEVSLLLTGDFYINQKLDNSVQTIFEIFNDFLPYLETSDIAITNFESPIVDGQNSINKTGPSLRTNPNSLRLLKQAGFNMVTLANNHIMDYGNIGLKSTIDYCKSFGIEYIGAGRNMEEASAFRIININDIKLGFINVAENEFSTTQGDYPGANPLNPISIYKSIQQIKSEVDHIIVIVHGGHEQYSLPSPRMKELYRYFIDVGARVVVSHHTHCHSGFEDYKGGAIFYGLGNFIFEWDSKLYDGWYNALTVQVLFSKESFKYKVIPIRLYEDKAGLRLLNQEELIKFNNNIEALNKTILNDKELEIAFSEYCTKVSRSYNAYLEPHSNRAFRFLQYKKIIPSILSKRKRRLLLNLVRCESHRDVLLEVLNKTDDSNS